jgi:hypothetical protein
MVCFRCIIVNTLLKVCNKYKIITTTTTTTLFVVVAAGIAVILILSHFPSLSCLLSCECGLKLEEIMLLYQKIWMLAEHTLLG